MSERRAAPLIVGEAGRSRRFARVRCARTRCTRRCSRTSAPRLTVVVAPAGWGKTTLLSQWAHDPAETRGIVWVSLDEADDDPVRFWTYVLTALQRDVPGLGPAALRRAVHPGSRSGRPRAADAAQRADRRSTTEHVLVLDDYHLLGDRRRPRERRVPARLPAGRAAGGDRRAVGPAAAAGPATGPRRADASSGPPTWASPSTRRPRCSPPSVTRRSTPPRHRALGAHRGLGGRAAARGPDRPRRGPAGRGRRPVHGDDRHILDYLSTEVVDRLAPDQRDLLVRAAVLERLSGPLCDACSAAQRIRDVLDALDRADLFVVPLDPRREWYRCHRLFRDVLLRRLADDPGRTHRACSPGPPTGSSLAATSPRPSSTGSPRATRTARRTCCARRSRCFLERGELAVTCSWVGSWPAPTCCGTRGCACPWPGPPA